MPEKLDGTPATRVPTEHKIISKTNNHSIETGKSFDSKSVSSTLPPYTAAPSVDVLNVDMDEYRARGMLSVDEKDTNVFATAPVAFRTPVNNTPNNTTKNKRTKKNSASRGKGKKKLKQSNREPALMQQNERAKYGKYDYGSQADFDEHSEDTPALHSSSSSSDNSDEDDGAPTQL
jgi:hypothetical protein